MNVIEAELIPQFTASFVLLPKSTCTPQIPALRTCNSLRNSREYQTSTDVQNCSYKFKRLSGMTGKFNSTVQAQISGSASSIIPSSTSTGVHTTQVQTTSATQHGAGSKMAGMSLAGLLGLVGASVAML